MNFTHQSFSAIFLLAVLLYKTAPAFDEMDIQELPRDEKEAQILLREGMLDSILWRKVEPFYTTPLSVPRGELRILQDLFFSLPDDLPSTAAALSKYFPWDNAAQERLFTEYPELLPFKPILSFENSGTEKVPGEMAFCFSRPFNSDTVRQYALFSAGEKSSISAEGRVDFTDAYGRWYRRTVTVVPCSGSRVSIGNFGANNGDGLFTGYFPAVSIIDTSLAGNWLYGKSRSWNGVFLSMEGSDREKKRSTLTGKAFMHAGPLERIGHGEGTVAITKRVSLWSGLSYLETVDSGHTEEFGYFHFGLSIASPDKHRNNYQIDLKSGIDLRNPELVPFDVTWSLRGERSRLRATLTGLPDGFYAPRSALGHAITGKTGVGDTIDGYTTSTDVQFTHLQSTFLAWTPRITAIFAGDALRYLTTGIGASGRIAFGSAYRVQYSWSLLFRAGGQDAFRRQGSLELSIPVSSSICCTLTNSYSSVSDGYWRYLGTITPQFEVGRVVRIAPLFVLSAAGTQSFDKIIGLQATLQFTGKTFSEITIEKQIPARNGNSINAQGRMSFLF